MLRPPWLGTKTLKRYWVALGIIVLIGIGPMLLAMIVDLYLRAHGCHAGSSNIGMGVCTGLPIGNQQGLSEFAFGSSLAIFITFPLAIVASGIWLVVLVVQTIRNAL